MRGPVPEGTDPAVWVPWNADEVAWQARGAALSAPAVPQWMPIETAPKDVLVDIWLDGRRYADCHYDRICDEFRHITKCGVLVHLKKATHWMPLPAAPSAKEPQT